MAGRISSLLLLTLQFMILDCTKRTLRLVYKPYGLEMCRQLCDDLDYNFYYLPGDLSCRRVPRKYSTGSIMDSLKHCLMEDISRNHVPALPLKTELHICNQHNDDVHQFNPQHLGAKSTRGGDLNVGHVSLNSSLHQACEEGKLCTVVKFILSQRPTDINARDKLGRTPAMTAVINHQVTVFDFLVSQSCELMTVDNNNDTVLHTACNVGNVDTVKTLLNYRTWDIEIRGWNGMTPAMCSALHGNRDVFDLVACKGCNMSALDDNKNNIFHVACSGGHVAMVKYILRKLNNSIIESRGEKGRTPVMIAAHSGHTGVFDFLTSNGSNLFAVDDNHDNILHVACIGGHVDMVQHIIGKMLMNIESRGKYGRTPVMRAAEYGQSSVVNFFASNGCNLTAVDNNTDTLLHVACEGGHVDMVKHLLFKWKLAIDRRGQHGWTPVMRAAYFGQKYVIMFLVSQRCKMIILDNDKNNILHVACMSGNVNLVQYILSQRKVGVDSRGQYGRTPVMTAAYFGCTAVVKYLVRKGCTMTVLDNDKNNILHVASRGGHVGTLKLILSQTNFSIDSRGHYGRTPAMMAAASGHMSVVKHLVRKGCKLSMVDSRGNNILHLTCASGNVDLVQYIVSQTKVGVDSRGQYGRTPVMMAAYFGCTAVVKYLVRKGCTMTLLDNNKNNILHVASSGGHVGTLKCILSQTNISIDSRGNYKRTPVMIAAYCGRTAVVKYLVRKGCIMTIFDEKNNNILHVASRGGHVVTLKYILSQMNIPIDSKGQYGQTPVMMAASFGHMSVVKYLMGKGCKLSLVDSKGYNILHAACMSANVNLVKHILSETKIGVDSRGRNKWTPVMTAAKCGHTAIVKYLVRRGCKLSVLDSQGSNILHVACMSGNVDMVKYILSQTKFGVESKGKYGRTPVMTAARYGNTAIVKYLVRRGCKLSVLDSQGRNILHVACMSGNVDMVKYILSQTKLGVDSRGQHGQTPVMAAASFGHTTTVKYLVRKGCKLTNVDERGATVLEMACERRHDDVVKYLIRIKSWSKTC